MRRTRRFSSVDVYCIQVICAKLLVDTADRRRVSLKTLANEIAPELVSMPTALRYIRDLERAGHATIIKNHRENIIKPTASFFSHYEGRVRKFHGDLEKEGYVLPRAQELIELDEVA